MRMRISLTILLCMAVAWYGVPVCAASPSVSSLSAVVYEPESGLVLYEKAGDTPRPMASTTKLMTALLAAERLDPDATVSVPASALPVEGTQVGLAAGESVTVRDLLAALLLASGNDAANALALLMAEDIPAFAALMNQRAAQLGMTHSTFVTPSGLDAGEHSASARDMALLGAAVLEQPLLAQLCAAKTATVTLGGRRVTLNNHNKLLNLLDDCIGLKTGFTKKSGRCLVSAVRRDGVTLIVATLNGGDYWNDHISLYEYGFSRVKREALPPLEPHSCGVCGGVADRVSVSAALPEDAVLHTGESLRMRVELPRFIWAPVAAGDSLGTVTVYAGERTVCTVPLTADTAVESRPLPSYGQLVRRRYAQLFGRLLD